MQRSRSNTKRVKTSSTKTRQVTAASPTRAVQTLSTLTSASKAVSPAKTHGRVTTRIASRPSTLSIASSSDQSSAGAVKRRMVHTTQSASISTKLQLHSVKPSTSSMPFTSTTTAVTPTVTKMPKQAFSSSFDYKNQFDADDEYKARYNKYFSNLKPGLEQYGSHDGNYELYRYDPHEADTRNSNYMMLASTKAMYAGIGRASVSKLLAHMQASADVLAMASIEVDLGAFEEGTTTTLKWRGKPVFVKHRTPEEIDSALKDDNVNMIDPEKDSERTQKANWLIVVGVCTHLGCVPIPNAGDFAGGFFCPCHGSHYDTSGRIRLGPAPLNLEVPPYRFVDDTTVVIG